MPLSLQWDDLDGGSEFAEKTLILMGEYASVIIRDYKVYKIAVFNLLQPELMRWHQELDHKYPATIATVSKEQSSQ